MTRCRSKFPTPEPGLTPEESSRLFTPYYTTKQQGTGLGLAIVQSVVSDHYGTISSRSEEGHGTTSRIEFAAATGWSDCRNRCRSKTGQIARRCRRKRLKGEGRPSSLPRRRTDSFDTRSRRCVAEDSVTKKAHLLLVDDDPNTLASLSRAFRLAGHEATDLRQRHRALDLLRSETFDLVLSDVVMPGKTGHRIPLEDLKKAGNKNAHRPGFRPGQYRNGGARHEIRCDGFSRKAAFHRQTAADLENAMQPDAAAKRKPANCAAGSASTNWWASAQRCNDSWRANRAGGHQRNARVHPRRNRNRQRTGRARHS